MLDDGVFLPLALALYVLASLAAVWIALRRGASYRLPLVTMTLGLLAHSLAIGLRWRRLDHGPFVDLFEILSSNIWSLHLAVLIAVLLIPRIRPILAVVLPLLQILVFWLLTVEPSGAEIPVTYDTPWLSVHVAFGKIFLGALIVATALSMAIILRSRGLASLPHLPASAALGELAYRFVLGAFLFESLMLVAGAIWAQDAWGRYWAWDPLETWAFVTWVAAAAYLHLRTRKGVSQEIKALAVLCVFILAFATFFGMPFVSTAPHKGAI
jgi:ABC-type transport system involved in cytochrome c biogenesis permease subunit